MTKLVAIHFCPEGPNFLASMDKNCFMCIDRPAKPSGKKIRKLKEKKGEGK